MEGKIASNIRDPYLINKMNREMSFTTAFKDLVMLVFITIIVLILSYFFNVFVFLIELFQKHPKALTYIDEIITGFLTLSIGLAIFSWRRWKELKKETAERIKRQEEILRLTTTQAEVERIISKQLRSDMDQMKEDVREILHLLLNKYKK